MIKRAVVSIIVIFQIFFLSSCSYRDINNLSLALAMFIDIDEKNSDVIVYIELFKPLKGSASQDNQNAAIFLKGIGKTITGAIDVIRLSSNYKLDFSQNKIIVFSKKITELGIGDYIDRFDRRQEFSSTNYLAIYDGELNDVMEKDIKQEKYIGVFLNHLFGNIKNESNGFNIDIHNFFNKKFLGDKINIIPIISSDSGVPDMEMKIKNYGVMRDYKLINTLDKKDIEIFNLLMDKRKKGNIEIVNPMDRKKYIVLNSSKHKIKTTIEYKNENVNIKKHINLETSFWEVQGDIILNKKTVEQIQKQVEIDIKQRVTKLFDESRDKGIDLFDISEKVKRKYRNIDFSNIELIRKSYLDVEINVKINNPMIITDHK